MHLARALSPFWAGATHVVQLGADMDRTAGPRAAAQRRAVTPTTRPRAGVANSSLETYECENVLILNLFGAAALFNCRFVQLPPWVGATAPFYLCLFN